MNCYEFRILEGKKSSPFAVVVEANTVAEAIVKAKEYLGPSERLGKLIEIEDIEEHPTL